MKKANIFLLSIFSLALIGCAEKITNSDLNKAKSNLADDRLDEYLKKYDIKGSDGANQVYYHKDEQFDINSELQSFASICSQYFDVAEDNIEKYEISYGRYRYFVKDDSIVDNSAFKQCLEGKLSKTELSFNNLQALSNSKEVKEYKEKYPYIAKLIEDAKSDGKITILEAMNIYLAIYQQKEKDLFQQI